MKDFILLWVQKRPEMPRDYTLEDIPFEVILILSSYLTQDDAACLSRTTQTLRAKLLPVVYQKASIHVTTPESLSQKKVKPIEEYSIPLVNSGSIPDAVFFNRRKKFSWLNKNFVRELTFQFPRDLKSHLFTKPQTQATESSLSSENSRVTLLDLEPNLLKATFPHLKTIKTEFLISSRNSIEEDTSVEPYIKVFEYFKRLGLKVSPSFSIEFEANNKNILADLSEFYWNAINMKYKEEVIRPVSLMRSNFVRMVTRLIINFKTIGVNGANLNQNDMLSRSSGQFYIDRERTTYYDRYFLISFLKQLPDLTSLSLLGFPEDALLDIYQILYDNYYNLEKNVFSLDYCRLLVGPPTIKTFFLSNFRPGSTIGKKSTAYPQLKNVLDFIDCFEISTYKNPIILEAIRKMHSYRLQETEHSKQFGLLVNHVFSVPADEANGCERKPGKNLKQLSLKYYHTTQPIYTTSSQRSKALPYDQDFYYISFVKAKNLKVFSWEPTLFSSDTNGSTFDPSIPVVDDRQIAIRFETIQVLCELLNKENPELSTKIARFGLKNYSSKVRMWTLAGVLDDIEGIALFYDLYINWVPKARDVLSKHRYSSLEDPGFLMMVSFTLIFGVTYFETVAWNKNSVEKDIKMMLVKGQKLTGKKRDDEPHLLSLESIATRYCLQLLSSFQEISRFLCNTPSLKYVYLENLNGLQYNPAFVHYRKVLFDNSNSYGLHILVFRSSRLSINRVGFDTSSENKQLEENKSDSSSKAIDEHNHSNINATNVNIKTEAHNQTKYINKSNELQTEEAFVNYTFLHNDIVLKDECQQYRVFGGVSLVELYRQKVDPERYRQDYSSYSKAGEIIKFINEVTSGLHQL